MPFTTITIGFIILAMVCFYTLPGIRPLTLLLFSLSYCFFLDPSSLIFLLLNTAFTYISGLLIFNQKKKNQNSIAKITLCFSIFLFAIVLIIYKHFAWLSGYFSNDSIHGIGAKLILPIGISFYTFQSISYLADIYNQKIDAEKNILRLALYQSFFPKFMSGPIEKYERQKNDYLSLSSVHLFDANRLSTSFIYIITGYFMKLMVADRLALYVDKIFESYSILSSPLIVLGAVGYTIQIYFDFAGYSFTAIGIANLFGVNLISNFNNPYLAENIVDFWRRWHISLSTWLKDYIYIPLGGNRNGEIHKYINTMIVFTVCGFWHGSGLNFIAWGLLHGIFSVIENYMLKRNINFLFKGIIGRILNFILVGFAWIFFKASSLGHAIMYIKSMLTSFHADKTFSEQLEIIELPQLEINILLLSILAFFILEIISYRSKCTVPEYISDKKPVIKYGYLYLSLILILIYGIYGGLNTGTTFIYMQF